MTQVETVQSFFKDFCQLTEESFRNNKGSTMKKTTGVLLSLLFLAACGSNPKKAEHQPEPREPAAAEVKESPCKVEKHAKRDWYRHTIDGKPVKRSWYTQKQAESHFAHSKKQGHCG